jgi:hypothetical protein
LAYKVELPEELIGVHLVFHVSQLRKCLQLLEQEVHIDALDIQDTLEYKEHLIWILDRAEKETRSTMIPMCKVQWSNHTEQEAAWEESELEIFVRGKDCNNLEISINQKSKLQFFFSKITMYGEVSNRKPTLVAQAVLIIDAYILAFN